MHILTAAKVVTDIHNGAHCMRIIAGKHKGRKLLPPIDQHITRPITDRVKQSLFDRLSVDGLLEDAVVLDACSGTGSMGIEALSRGAAHVTFIEREHRIRRLLTRNVEAIRQVEDSTILNVDAMSFRAIECLRKRKYTLLFFDPPYKVFYDDPDRSRAYKQMSRFSQIADPDALMLVRTSSKTEMHDADPWYLLNTRKYGSMGLHDYSLHAPVDEEEVTDDEISEVDD